MKLPQSCYYISSSTFEGCESLTSIDIPLSVTSISDHAFYKCYNLSQITITPTTTNISDTAFDLTNIGTVRCVAGSDADKFARSKGFTCDYYIDSTDYQDVSVSSVTLSSYEYTYDGTSVEPKPSVSIGGTHLSSYSDFDLYYSDNDDAGTATITIVGKGKYHGTRTFTFEIAADTASERSVYRLYNPITSEHLFTTSSSEYSSLTAHNWKQEGISWTSPTAGKGVYRVYNPGLGAMTKMSHHYTSDYAEAADLVANHGWQWDNGGKPIFYSAEDDSGAALEGASAVYRLYNGGLSAHHFTLDASESSSLISDHGWNGEGVGFYAYPLNDQT